MSRLKAKILLTGLGVLATSGFLLAPRIHQYFLLRNNAADRLRFRADDLSWKNQWIAARPLYASAELLYEKQGRGSEALYSHISQFIPRAETEPATGLLFELNSDLQKPEARDPATKLRILEIEGMIAANYDASLARKTWKDVQALAQEQHRYSLAMRARGEQGIAAFLLGDVASAKKLVTRAWLAAKVLHDQAAHVRYASAYGAGLVEIQRYNEALKALDDAIHTAENSDGVAYPTIAVNSKIDALCGLGRYREALALADQALHRLPSGELDAHRFQLHTSKGNVYEAMEFFDDASVEYGQALVYARRIQYWRGIVQTGGLQAAAYERRGLLHEALMAINEALYANTRIPDELYFSPRNLGIKAKILSRMGHSQKAAELYEKSAHLLDSLFATAPTPNVERQLISEMREVYADYYEMLSLQGKVAAAFRVIEQARGRVELEALRDHAPTTPHLPSPEEKYVTELNLRLLKADRRGSSEILARELYEAELQLDASTPGGKRTRAPVSLKSVQHHLGPNELLLEFVMANPASSVLAITDRSVHRYTLVSWKTLRPQVSAYRKTLKGRRSDQALARTLFSELLAPVHEYKTKPTVLLVPDEELHLLPFGALVDDEKFAIEDHTFSSTPSATVLSLLRDRAVGTIDDSLSYVGVAAWTAPPQTVPATAVRGVADDSLSLPFLPQTAREVELVAQDLKGPGTMLIGAEATESHFKHLPLGQYKVLHLALHAFADVEFPDRSALVFAPQEDGRDDGLLEAREIRELHLNAKLVTLSACDTGVGAIGASDVANLVNAFIEAGSSTVVSSQWSLEDAATERLMAAFYEALTKGVAADDALRQGQLLLLRSGLPPYYWAGFQIAGNPAPR